MKPATLRWLLAASVALNLFMVTALVGAAAWWFAGDYRTAGASAPPLRGLRLAAESLPETERAALRQRLRETRQALQPQIQAAREGRRELARLLAAPQFDRAAALATAERTRSAELATRTRIETAVVDFAATLPPDSRSTLAEGMVQHGPLRAPTRPQRPASGSAP